MPVSPYRNDLIKGAMAERDLQVKDVADMAGVSVTTVSTIRMGNPVTLSSLISVARALRLDMALLFTPRPEEPQDTKSAPQLQRT